MCNAVGACRNRPIVNQRETGIASPGGGVQKGEIIGIVGSELGSNDPTLERIKGGCCSNFFFLLSNLLP